VLPLAEHHSLEIAGQLLGRGAAMDRGAFERHAEQWRPWRTWAAVALRAAGPLVAQ
jgi:DNA-3-methyladenine glycosylase II